MRFFGIGSAWDNTAMDMGVTDIRAVVQEMSGLKVDISDQANIALHLEVAFKRDFPVFHGERDAKGLQNIGGEILAWRQRLPRKPGPEHHALTLITMGMHNPDHLPFGQGNP